MDKVSIIVPVYNIEQYLEQCIDSIINQTYKNIEVLLIDDGSTDNSGKICERYEKEYGHIKVIHQINGGLCAARNIGLDNATGKYICFIDSDDYIEKEYVEKLYHEVKLYDLDIAYCNFRLFEDNKELGKKEKQYLLTREEITGLQYQILRFKNNDWDCQVWVGMYKKEFLLKNNLSFYKEDRLLYEDILFTNKSLLKAERVKFISYYGYNYRNRWQDSLCRQKLNEWTMKSYYNIMNEFIDLYNNSASKEEKSIIGQTLYKVLTSLLESIYYCDEINKSQYYKMVSNTKIKKILRENINSKKDLMKCIIFNINLKLYYEIFGLKQRIVS